jgi:hypothetical protein
MTTSDTAEHGIFHGHVDARELGVVPKKGRLVALRTRDELRASTELCKFTGRSDSCRCRLIVAVDAYVVEVPAIYASALLKYVNRLGVRDSNRLA